MLRFLIPGLILLPLAEIVGFILAARWIGIGVTLLLVVAGAFAGMALLRNAGVGAPGRLRMALARGEEPGHSLIDAVCFAAAGILLIVPGFFSDLIAIALLLPPVRDFLLRRVAGRFQVRSYGTFGQGATPRYPPGFDPGGARTPGNVIDADYAVIEPDAPRIEDETSKDKQNKPS